MLGILQLLDVYFRCLLSSFSVPVSVPVPVSVQICFRFRFRFKFYKYNFGSVPVPVEILVPVDHYLALCSYLEKVTLYVFAVVVYSRQIFQNAFANKAEKYNCV
jgi:hypothetical protein